MAKINLQTQTSRARLAPRGRPYQVRLIPGVHLGYRAAQSGTGAWVVIAADGKGAQWQKVIGHADDQQASDGTAVLSYEQAALRARAMARGDANAAADRPASISEALTAYEADLTARGRNPYNAGLVRTHLPAHLSAQPLSQVTVKQLRHWRDALIKAGMKPATVNRVLKPAHASFNLAGKLDPRVAANAQSWKIGLEALRNTVTRCGTDRRAGVGGGCRRLRAVGRLRALCAGARRGRRTLQPIGAARRRRPGARPADGAGVAQRPRRSQGR
jgi:hypothetical protein